MCVGLAPLPSQQKESNSYSKVSLFDPFIGFESAGWIISNCTSFCAIIYQITPVCLLQNNNKSRTLDSWFMQPWLVEREAIVGKLFAWKYLLMAEIVTRWNNTRWNRYLFCCVFQLSKSPSFDSNTGLESYVSKENSYLEFRIPRPSMSL